MIKLRSQDVYRIKNKVCFLLCGILISDVEEDEHYMTNI
jgi:hypothetical protein